VKCSWVNCSEVLVKVSVTWCLTLFEDVYTCIYIYIYHKKFAAYMAFSFTTFFHILLVPLFIGVYMFVCFVCFYLIL
jgi:hypothetical protein